MVSASDPDSQFRASLANVNLLMREGHSFSGHEKNCAFLNLRDGRFATVSSVAGFDFADDSRAIALTDWDHDGLLDVWLSNRTAPRVRLLRNQSGTGNRSLALRLVGTKSNRDGIGARVEVSVAGQSVPLIETSRAGDGFLAQSSKWLHFGLGEADQAEQVKVSWPSGVVDTLGSLAAGRSYEVREGTGQAISVELKRTSLGQGAELAELRPLGNQPGSQVGVRVPLADPIPVPTLPYRDFKGELRRVDFSGKTLVTLWASWCAPCIRELREVAKSEDLLREAGIDVVALSVDEQARSNNNDDQELDEKLITKMGFPFRAGRATLECVERYHTIAELPFGLQLELATPTSILVDRDQKLLAIYRGPVEVKQVIEDATKLSAGRATSAALPLRGKWFLRPKGTKILRIARELVDREQLEDATEYVRANQARISQEKEFAKLAVWIGGERIKLGDDLGGLEFHEMALESGNQELLVLNNVAWQLATSADRRVRDGARAVRWSEKAAELTKFKDPNVLATLAASYAEAGSFEKAVVTCTAALRIAETQRNKALYDRLSERLELFKDRKPYHSQ